MATYEVNFAAAQAAATHLQEILTSLQTQMKRMDEIQTTMLNDSLWYGPNKTKYTQKFTQYKNALATLYSNAVDQLGKLNEIIKTYANAEMN